MLFALSLELGLTVWPAWAPECSGSDGLGLARLAHKRPSSFLLVLWERHLSRKSEYAETLMSGRPHAGVSATPGGSWPHSCHIHAPS